MDGAGLAVPEAAVLLHIGPHKTGTSAVQGALIAAGPRLADAHVHFAGGRSRVRAARAVTGSGGRPGQPDPPISLWHDLVREVAATTDQRVVVSSEFFSQADEPTRNRIVDDLGRSRVHVVITLRPLRRILPSQWQQYVQSGIMTMSYEHWLERVMGRSQRPATPTFWVRHDHGALVTRWVQTVGADRVTVVVLDESDPAMLIRTFDALLGLPPGLLVNVPDAANRSLTAAEVEVIRALNVEFKQRGWMARYTPLVGFGVAHQMKVGRKVGAGEARLTTPVWALEEAGRRGGEFAAVIAASGARVVGDLAVLSSPAHDSEIAPESEAAPLLDPQAAAQAVVGAILGGGLDGSPGRRGRPRKDASGR